MKKEFGVALKQKPLDEGLTKSEINYLFDKLKGIDAIPVEIQGENASAMGFIDPTDAEFLDYKYDNDSELGFFIKNILDDVNNESNNNEYEMDIPGVGTIDIYLGY